MDTILQDLKGVICYIDDILITGASEEEHLESLEQVLRRLQEYGVRMKMQVFLHAFQCRILGTSY